MVWFRAFSHRCRWLALVAMLLVALAPTASRLLAAQQALPAWMQDICSARHTATADHASESPVAIDLDHCQYCALGLTLAGPPPVASATLPLLMAGLLLPLLLLAAPRPLFLWALASPRAPPFYA